MRCKRCYMPFLFARSSLINYSMPALIAAISAWPRALRGVRIGGSARIRAGRGDNRNTRSPRRIASSTLICDLQAKTTPRLATLDQLNRVIYARSFSKTLSGSLRVGFIACAQDIANELADIKMLTSITTSQFTERLLYLMLVDGPYRKHLSRLHERLGQARLNVVRAFERIGMELFVEPADGMFVWARLPQAEDSLALAEISQRDGIMLAPGAVFRPNLERSPWMRFNVTVCEDTRVQCWLQRQAAGKAA